MNFLDINIYLPLLIVICATKGRNLISVKISFRGGLHDSSRKLK